MYVSCTEQMACTERRMHKRLDGNVRPMYKRAMVHLADYMADKGLSDEDVAKGIDRSRPTVSRIRRRLVRSRLGNNREDHLAAANASRVR
jgi:hypothetical protein